MKHILDSSFRYKPSFDTDVRKTFEKVRRQQQMQDRSSPAKDEDTKASAVTRVKVLQIDHLKKASG